MPDRGLQFLERKLAIYVHGTGSTRRNPALDVLVGRVPDERLATLSASIAATSPAAPSAPAATPETNVVAPSTVVLPLAAVRMAAVARAKRPGSPWLSPGAESHPPLHLMDPPRDHFWQRLRRRLRRFLPRAVDRRR